jgi:hypothetical protein
VMDVSRRHWVCVFVLLCYVTKPPSEYKWTFGNKACLIFVLNETYVNVAIHNVFVLYSSMGLGWNQVYYEECRLLGCYAVGLL